MLESERLGRIFDGELEKNSGQNLNLSGVGCRIKRSRGSRVDGTMSWGRDEDGADMTVSGRWVPNACK